MLISFSGLPGAGETTLARELAHRLGAVYLRIDTIEQSLARTDTASVGEAGYRVAYAVARDDLQLGRTVVADCVNPLRITRDALRDVAASGLDPDNGGSKAGSATCAPMPEKSGIDVPRLDSCVNATDANSRI